jgi:hypothetical protein
MTTQRDRIPKDINEAFFPVERRALFMRAHNDRSKFQELPSHFAVMDVERETPFAVVTDNYELVTNEDAYEMAKEVMARVFHTLRIDDLECLNITMPATRSFCHIDLIDRTSDFSPWKEDKWTAFLRISNSYNRTRLLKFEIGFCRWICLNGVIFGSKSIEFSDSHTTLGKERVKHFAENIGDIRKLESAMTEKLHQLKRCPVPEKEMLPLLCRAFDIKWTVEDLTDHQRRINNLVSFRERTGQLVQSYFSEMGPHGYAALNVLTDYATYPTGGIAPEGRIDNLQQKVGRWVDDFIAAASFPDFSFDSYLAEYRQTAEIIESLQAA